MLFASLSPHVLDPPTDKDSIGERDRDLDSHDGVRDCDVLDWFDLFLLITLLSLHVLVPLIDNDSIGERDRDLDVLDSQRDEDRDRDLLD